MKSTLEGITTGNGYKTTVVTVEALAKSWAGVKPGERPWIGVVPQKESFEHTPFGGIRVRLPIAIIAHVSGTSQDDRASKLNDLLDDIIAVLNVDTTRNAKAIFTSVIGVDTDEGDPDGYGDGSMVVNVDVVYLRTTSGS